MIIYYDDVVCEIIGRLQSGRITTKDRWMLKKLNEWLHNDKECE